MKQFNLSDWALRHRSFVWFLMILSLIAGAVTYLNLGREEDPNFSIKTMIISAALPGADINETLNQVTDRIEKKLEELDEIDATRSVTMPGETVVYVDLLPTTPAGEIPRIWQRVRNMMGDIEADFPAEFAGFQFNDSFGDVFGNIYAFTADGFSPRELRDYVEAVRTEVQALPDAGKATLIGTRDEVIFLEFSARRIAALGLDQRQVLATLSDQNAIVPSGVINAGDERVLVRVGGQFSDADSLAAVNLRVGDRFFNLGDVAEIRRGYQNPPHDLFRYNGQEAIALAIGMRDGGNILDFGKDLDELMRRVEARLPVGVGLYHVADQPHVVEYAVGHFVQALVEAIVIVLAVTFVSLGLRAGFVVTLTIPLVLAITFVILDYYGITLQRISLGALIIALGLLVDDAMIAIETMISRLELGESLTKAASYAWTSIAFPMLSGTLVTVVGFIPIGLNSSAAGEYTFSLFVVIAVSLLVSWVVAVLFAPLLGVTFLSKKLAHHDGTPGRLRRMFHVLLRAAMRFRYPTVLLTVAVFGLSVWGLSFIQIQFFPSSDRSELVVDVTLRQNATIDETRRQMDRLEAHFADDDDIDYWTSYVGQGAPRFLLTFEGPTPAPYVGQIVLKTGSVEARDRVKARIEALANTEFAGVDILAKLLELGPPVGKPVQYRISGADTGILRDRARDLAAMLSTDPRLTAITLDWSEPARVLRLDINQDKARQLGVSVEDIALSLNAIFNGQTITQLRDETYLVDIVVRGRDEDRQMVESLNNLQLASASGVIIPLASLATMHPEIEQPVIRQRNRLPTITIKAAIATDDQPATIVGGLKAAVAEFSDALPVGYFIETGGAVEESGDSQGPIWDVVPLMVVGMLMLVMIQMQSFRLSLVVLSAAPLGLIGVVVALVLSGAPLGFVAILGVLALIGILVRNSIILVNEVEELRKKGRDRWNAVFEASDSRARPILLTAAAASLALIPISRQVFWGPMAYAMMGGIIAGTLVTLLFIPSLYLLVFRVRGPEPDQAEE
ncbi:efflux RND transporter permease subunit [Actibacterium sp. D379-3]